MPQKKLIFSKAAERELRIMTEAVKDVIQMTIEAYKNNDLEMAKKVEPLE